MNAVCKHSLYEHFKGNLYYVVNVSMPVPRQEWIQITRKSSVWTYPHEHTETGEIIQVAYGINGSLWHCSEVSSERLVMYIAQTAERERWAREIKMFESKVDAEKYPEHAGKARFELVRKGA